MPNACRTLVNFFLGACGGAQRRGGTAPHFFAGGYSAPLGAERLLAERLPNACRTLAERLPNTQWTDSSTSTQCRCRPSRPCPISWTTRSRLRGRRRGAQQWTALATSIHHDYGCRCQTPNNVPGGSQIMGQYMVVGTHDCVRRNGVNTHIHQ